MGNWSVALLVLGALAVALGVWLQRRHRRREAPLPVRTAPRAPDRYGPYVVLGRLGAGGMGTVYEARHETLGRSTALKIAKPDSRDPHQAERFEREALLTSALRHPNVVTLFDHGRDEEGTAWIALEHLGGVTLDGLLRAEGPLPAARVLPILRQVALALAHAHAASIVHRDVKPSNVMVERDGDEDVVKLIDFGLAKRIAPERRDRPRTSIVGTPLFMAPESSDPEADVGPEVDVYGVGMIGWALLTGSFLFADHASGSLPRAHEKEPPLPPSLKTDAHVPADLEAVLLRCLEKDPASRFADGEALVAALKACATPLEDPLPRRPPMESGTTLRAEGDTIAFPLVRRLADEAP